MAVKSVFLLFCFSLLQFRGVCSDHIYLHHRPGEDVTLLCDAVKHEGPKCSTVDWRHEWTYLNYTFVVWEGQIRTSSRSSRLTLNSDCSLSVQNITEGDYGMYICGSWNTQNETYDSLTYFSLSVLSVSPVQPSFSQTSGDITLQCKMWRYYSLPNCEQDSFLWLDTNGTVLSGDGATQKNCESNLTVELQSPEPRTFTCQYQEDGRVLVSAEYSLSGNTGPWESKPLPVHIISAAVGAVLGLLAVAAALSFKMKSNKKTAETTDDTEDDPPGDHAVTDPESVTYAAIDHHKPKARKQINEDSVTYSAVNVQSTARADHSAIYSQVNSTAQD